MIQILLYAFLGGIILNLMPCVLPVMGLKMRSFLGQAGKDKSEIIKLNLAYVSGLIFVFMILATLACLTQLGLASENFGWGELYTLAWFKISMIVLTFGMGLSFLGVWDLPIPGLATSDKATELSTKQGVVGAFSIGVLTTLLATPCSGPFLGPVFGYCLGQSPLVIYSIFLSIAIGMGIPYLIVAMNPALISLLPKPGQWMNKVKYGSGILLILTSVWLGSSFYSPVSNSTIPWELYSETKLQEYLQQDRTVLIDFSSSVCLTCVFNMENAIDTEETRKVLKDNNIICMQAHLEDGPEVKNKLNELGFFSVPLVAIYKKDGVVLLPDLINKDELWEALR